MTHSTRIELYPPEINGQDVLFRWDVSPPADLYNANSFTLSFPDEVDPGRIPDRLWWTVFLLCVHSHWTLLRPCTVHLPVKLAPGESDGWERLLDSYVATLQALRGSDDFDRRIEIIEGGTILEPVVPLEDMGVYASAFSGGKDSLVQAAMLCELTERPILVTTTSPMPPLLDHIAPQRRELFDALRERRDVTFVEVHSDCRTACDNGAVWRTHKVGVNEISDTFLYTAVLLVVGYALGATHLFLASESEVSENDSVAGRFVQHKHFMYSALTQAGIRAMLAHAGLYYGSLTSALHSSQVQELLTTRYPDLSDLQFTCWQISEGQRACSGCGECKRLAWVILSLGGSPAHMGVDLVHLLNNHGVLEEPSREKRPHPPNYTAGERQHRQLLRAILATPYVRVLMHVIIHQPATLLKRKGWRALRAFRAIRRSVARDALASRAAAGYRAGFLEMLDPSLRAAVTSMFEQHFESEDEREYADQLERLTTAIDWVTEPFARMGGQREHTK